MLSDLNFCEKPPLDETAGSYFNLKIKFISNLLLLTYSKDFKYFF